MEREILAMTIESKPLYEGSSFWYINSDESVHGAIMTKGRAEYYTKRYRIYKFKHAAICNSKTGGM